MGRRKLGIMVVGIYAPETKVRGIIIMELMVWKAGELREIVAKNRPMALNAIAETNITAIRSRICRTPTRSPSKMPQVMVTTPCKVAMTAPDRMCPIEICVRAIGATRTSFI